MHKPGQCTYHVKVTNHLEEEPPIQDHPLGSRDFIDRSKWWNRNDILYLQWTNLYIVIKVDKKKADASNSKLSENSIFVENVNWFEINRQLID